MLIHLSEQALYVLARTKKIDKIVTKETEIMLMDDAYLFSDFCLGFSNNSSAIALAFVLITVKPHI